MLVVAVVLLGGCAGEGSGAGWRIFTQPQSCRDCGGLAVLHETARGGFAVNETFSLGPSQELSALYSSDIPAGHYFLEWTGRGSDLVTVSLHGLPRTCGQDADAEAWNLTWMHQDGSCKAQLTVRHAIAAHGGAPLAWDVPALGRSGATAVVTFRSGAA